MKTTFLHLKNLIAVFFLFAVYSLHAQSSSKITMTQSSKSNDAIVVSEKADAIVINFQLNDLDLVQVRTNDTESFVVKSHKAANILISGEPDLFYLTRSIIIPDVGSSNIEIIPGNYKEVENIEIAPSKGNLLRSVNPDDVPYVKGPVYEKDAFYPQELAYLRDPYILRDMRGQSIDVFPVQYNPVTKTLRIYSDVKVIVTFNQGSGVNELHRTKQANRIETEFSNIYENLFINYDKTRYTPLGEEGELLIICYDDFIESMRPFVNWKRTIGRKTTIVPKSTAGTTAAAIKTYIANYYNHPDNNLAYVLLVGDAAQIPSNIVSGDDSDNAYGYILGNDSYNEVFIGRFSAENTTHVQTQVARMIHYERDLTTTDTWLKNGIGVAKNEGAGQGHNGEADYVHMDFIRDTLLNYTYTTVHREYDGGVPGLTNTTAAMISQRINEGASIINYCNHGSVTGWSVANYSSSHVNALTNVGKLPFIWSVACVNGNFVNYTCFAETWLRASSNGQPTGAIGTMMSTINQAWTPPMTGQDEMVTILSESYQNNIKRTFGGLSINGSMKMLDVHGSSGKETHDTWTLFGDPTLMVRTDTPQEMIISHNPTLFLGSSSFVVTCNTNGALVSMSYLDNNNTVNIGTAIVENGSATVTFNSPIVTPVDLTVAVTAYNKVTYTNSISAVPADEPYVILDSYNTTVSPDFGTSVGLNIALKNISEVPYTASNVNAILTTENQYVNITDSTLSAGTITPDQTLQFSQAYSFDIADNIPDQTNIVFTITITGSYGGESYEWAQNFVVVANAPVFTIGSISIDDNNQGIPQVLDPGETANAIIVISNTGHATASSINSTLTTESEFLNINQATVSLGSLAPGESTTASFSVTADSNTPLETAAIVSNSVSSGQYSSEKDLTIIIGYIPEYNMSNETVTACIGRFYDSGGPNNNYANNENFTKTFFPASGTSKLLFNFTSFEVENNYDKLYIYDGATTSAQQIQGSPFTGTNSPGLIRATNSQGAITFRFTSDNIVNKPGWVAEFHCFSFDNPPTCADHPTPENNSIALFSPTTLSWNFVADATEYDVFIGIESLPTTPTATVTTNSMSFDLEDNKNYVWKVVPKNPAGAATGCPIWNFKTKSLATTILMHTGTVTTCNSLFYDNGGENGNYTNNQDLTLTVLPSIEGAMVKVSFMSFDTETNYDMLKIFNGTSTSGTQLANLHGNSIPDDYVSTDISGALTFQFTSDYSVNKAGWKAHLSCEGGLSTEAFINSFDFAEDVVLSVSISDIIDYEATIDVVVTIGTDITSLTPTITVSEGATIEPAPSGPADFTNPVTYTVTSEDGSVVNNYVVNVTHEIIYYNVLFRALNSGEPVAEVEITVNSNTIYTGENGEASIELANGDYTYKAKKAGYTDIEGEFIVNNSDVTVNIQWNGINSQLSNSNIKLYPNPVGNELNIANTSTVKQIIITNSVGACVMNIENVDNESITISTDNLAPGFYLITFRTTNGDNITGRFIKQ